jgi:RNA-directed DNA polymerase
LINAYLKAGVMCPDGLHRMDKGTPQGGPLSPLLSNILLDDLDKELERRGHRFCRYADDCNIYVRTQQSGQRVIRSVTRYTEKTLKLKVNQKKSAVARPWKRTFLGFTFIKVFGKMRIHIPESSLEKFRQRVKTMLRMGRGRNVQRFIHESLNPVFRGWLNYFRPGASKRILRKLDFWIRRRMRCLIWRQWKRPGTRVRKLLSLGCSEEHCQMGWSRRGPWPCAGMPAMKQALDPLWFQKLNLFSMMATCYNAN